MQKLHLRGVSSSHIPSPLHFVQVLWARYPFDLINASPGRGKDAAGEHDAILNALTEGDMSAALLAMRQHIESGWSVLKAASAAEQG